MRTNKFLAGAFGMLTLLAMGSCANNGAEEPDNVLPDNGEPRYMSVTIRNSQDVRAADDEPVPEYEDGYSDENDVKSIRFYFFDESGNAANIIGGTKNYYDCPATDLVASNDKDAPNVERKINAMIVIDSSNGDLSNVSQMAAIVNYDATNLGTDKQGNLSKSQLLAVVNDSTALNVANGAKKDYVMTSSSFNNDEGVNDFAAHISSTDFKTDRQAALDAPVDVYVERVVAKVRVKTAWTSDMKTEEVTYKGKKYVAVALKDKKGPVYSTQNGREQVYVIFEGWNIWSTADHSYLFKNIGNWNLGWNWNDEAFYRSYWSLNTTEAKLKNYKHKEATKSIIPAEADFELKNDNYRAYTAYCLENAGEVAATGFKKTFDSTSQLSNRTVAYFKARLVTVDASTKVAKAVDLAEWAGVKYTKENLKTAMLSECVNRNGDYYFRSKVQVNDTQDGGTTTKYIYSPVEADDVELVSAIDADLADDKSQDSPRYRSYLNLKKDAFTNKKVGADKVEVEADVLYKKDAAGNYTKISDTDCVAEANNKYEAIGGAKVWTDGAAYYYKELEHLAPSTLPSAAEKGLYGVVRNHIYEVVLNSVTGLGTPVLNPDGDEVIIPQHPGQDYFYLGARMNILSWRLVKNNTSLAW